MFGVNNMKLSEQLSKNRQTEGELLRLYSIRKSLVEKSIPARLVNPEKYSEEMIIINEQKFLQEKKSKLSEIDTKTDRLKEYLIEVKNLINKINIELGIDQKLIEMKYLRIELANLMKLIKEDTYSSRIDIDIYEELGISQRIKELEARKAKLESHIQHTNWTNDLQHLQSQNNETRAP